MQTSLKDLKKKIHKAKKHVKTEENVKVKVQKIKRIPEPKSTFDEAIPIDDHDHHHDNVPSEEDNSDEAKAVEAEPLAPKAPLP